MADAARMTEVGIFALPPTSSSSTSRALYDAGELLPVLPDWFVAENKWRSARYGMTIVRRHHRELCDGIARLSEELAPAPAEDLHAR